MLIHAAFENCNCFNILCRSWDRGGWYICLWWCQKWHISPPGLILSFIVMFFSSSLFYVLLLCLSSWYARVCIFLALVICKLHHNWLAFAWLNILSDGIWGKCNHGSARSIIPGNLCFYKLVVKFEICSTSFTPLSPIFNTLSLHLFLNYAVFICDAWWILVVIIIVRPFSMPLQHFLPTFLFLASVEGTLLWGFS